MGKNFQALYDQWRKIKGRQEGRWVLYVYRRAVYFAEHPDPGPERHKWWNHKG